MVHFKFNNFINLELNEIVKSNADAIDKARHDWHSTLFRLRTCRPHEEDHYREAFKVIRITLAQRGELNWQARHELRRRAAAFGPQLWDDSDEAASTLGG